MLLSKHTSSRPNLRIPCLKVTLRKETFKTQHRREITNNKISVTTYHPGFTHHMTFCINAFETALFLKHFYGVSWFFFRVGELIQWINTSKALQQTPLHLDDLAFIWPWQFKQALFLTIWLKIDLSEFCNGAVDGQGSIA